MPNRSRYNPAHREMNRRRRDGLRHRGDVAWTKPEHTYHARILRRSEDLLPEIPDASVQLIICDPPYNLELAAWDHYSDYPAWASTWLGHVPRILSPTGSLVLFGGLQYQGSRGGDLLELMHQLRHASPLRLVNLIVWHYPNGQGAHRFFANRHEEIAWYALTDRYYFDLDAVRIPFDEATLREYAKDKRLRPESLAKGKNPTNVWRLNRLNGNAKERLGHPTQKPAAVIRRLVQSLSYPGAVVLDFFAGSAVTARVAIEEGRHSLLADSDPAFLGYHEAQLARCRSAEIPYTVLSNTEPGELPFWNLGPCR